MTKPDSAIPDVCSGCAPTMTRFLLASLAFYRRWLSPALHSINPGGCQYVPTCSEYAEMAIATHGPLRGIALAVWRFAAMSPLFTRGP